jgi:hypothetical protein
MTGKKSSQMNRRSFRRIISKVILTLLGNPRNTRDINHTSGEPLLRLRSLLQKRQESHRNKIHSRDIQPKSIVPFMKLDSME